MKSRDLNLKLRNNVSSIGIYDFPFVTVMNLLGYFMKLKEKKCVEMF